jgi:hypothetical protein
MVVRNGVAAGEVVIVKPAGVKPGARVTPAAPQP